eukprot:GFUD01055551.1.p1 GENE.GFUD01055551.1~~GFUD01055551.1.p1  ORF type:complete len:122 (-),score=16.05 GFUD01055551.1:39-404(-)
MVHSPGEVLVRDDGSTTSTSSWSSTGSRSSRNSNQRSFDILGVLHVLAKVFPFLDLHRGQLLVHDNDGKPTDHQHCYQLAHLMKAIDQSFLQPDRGNIQTFIQPKSGPFFQVLGFRILYTR